MAKIEFRNVDKSFGQVAALRDVTFSCADRDIVVVFGPPGAGKSTLLRVLAGLEDIDRGEIYLNGRAMNDLPIHRRNVAMAFENYALYPHFKVRANLEFPLKAPAVRMAAAQRRTRLERVAKLLEIEELLDRYPHQLSGGQRQRISLGRALIRDADATLLDEPIAHLDARLRSALRGDLRLYLRESGATTLYATPDFQEGFAIASKVIVLIGGVVRQISSPDEVFSRPADAHVAALIGDPAMNLIPVRADGRLDLGEQSSPLPVRINGLAQVGIRPGDIGLVDSTRSGVVVKGRVTLVERVGSALVINLDTGGRALAAKVDAPSMPVTLDDIVGLVFRWDAAHFFGQDATRIDIRGDFVTTDGRL
ncbi:MAG TPA: ABC transporter ATP-binding protein [Nitrobacter sp.]|nr:ABC transporter ATP-binding protein [Nitrobacter sp.]